MNAYLESVSSPTNVSAVKNHFAIANRPYAISTIPAGVSLGDVTNGDAAYMTHTDIATRYDDSWFMGATLPISTHGYQAVASPFETSGAIEQYTEGRYDT
jgi:hypothetical protein